MMPALMFGDVSGNHINPAFTLGLAASGLFSWVGVPGYLIAQLLGAFVGQAIVVWVHQPYYVQTENPNNILGTFSTISAVDDHDDTPENRNRAWANGFANEFAGSFLLFFGALALTNNYFGHKLGLNKQLQCWVRLKKLVNRPNGEWISCCSPHRCWFLGLLPWFSHLVDLQDQPLTQPVT